MYELRPLHIILLICLSATTLFSQQNSSNSPIGPSYLFSLDDARLDMGIRVVNVFALDDRAPLSSNPHFQAMWNLIKLGASLESLLQGLDEPLTDIDLGREFGQNGYNKTLFMLYLQFGFGESSDLELQQHFLELGLSSGYFKQGNGGLHMHLDYRYNVMKTNYGAGVNSISRLFDYEIFAGARIGFDYSSGRSESEAGFFSLLNDEVNRIAEENEFTVTQLLALEELVENSKILLPGDVGGKAFHVGPIAGAKLSTKFIGNMSVFAEGMGFYDLTDLSNKDNGKENRRSQHHITLSFGLSVTIGGEGRGLVDTSNINFF